MYCPYETFKQIYASALQHDFEQLCVVPNSPQIEEMVIEGPGEIPTEVASPEKSNTKEITKEKKKDKKKKDKKKEKKTKKKYKED